MSVYFVLRRIAGKENPSKLVSRYFSLIKSKDPIEAGKHLDETPSFNDDVVESLKVPKKFDALSQAADNFYLDTVAPVVPKSFNLAAYVNISDTLQKLLDLGVDLFCVERKGHGQLFADLDFEKDVKGHLKFLSDQGVPADRLGAFITSNPLLFKQSVEELETRILYLKSKNFTQEAISSIINRRPQWLNLKTSTVDGRLGWYQKHFNLTGDEVRFLATSQPKIIFIQKSHFREITFCLKEELGLTDLEAKDLLLKRPKVFLLKHETLLERFQFLHNELKIPHDLILLFPGSLLKRKFLMKQRHLYLQKLGKAQYDPKKPSYVSLHQLVLGNDAGFCQNVSKTSVQDFNAFLKTI